MFIRVNPWLNQAHLPGSACGRIEDAMSASIASMRPSINRQFVFAVRPTGMPDDSTFKLVESPIRELRDG